MGVGGEASGIGKSRTYISNHQLTPLKENAASRSEVRET